MKPTYQHEYKIGIYYGLAAYISWGFLPLFWKTLQTVPAWEVLAHRIVWSLAFVAVILWINRRWHEVWETFRSGKKMLAIVASGILISFNWVTFIWAVSNDHVVETSLGYYITPLFNVLLGTVVLREKLNLWQWVSFILAGVGVMVITVHYGSVPWIAIILTLTFGLYGLVKKVVNLDSVTALAMETMVVAPTALIYIIFLQREGTGMFMSESDSITWLLIASGVATALPLLWFARAAGRIPLSMVGFLQYVAPSISLVLGVFWFREPFTLAHLISFGLIWLALLIYTFSHTSLFVQRQQREVAGKQ